jgi:hypothetical protein
MVFTRASAPGSLRFIPNEGLFHSCPPCYSSPYTTWPLAIVSATEVSPMAFRAML